MTDSVPHAGEPARSRMRSAFRRWRRSIRWSWLWWDVVFPLGLPAIAALIVVPLWSTGPTPLPIIWSKILDVSPWTLTFFSITLLGTGIRKLADAKRMDTGIARTMILQSFLTGLYSGFLVIFRQTDHYEPSKSAYVVSLALMIFAVRTCHANAE